MKISKQTAEHYLWGAACDGWHLVKRDELSVIHERMPVGTAETPHYHERSRQFFFVLHGTATLIVDGISHTLQAQEGLEVPPHAPHQMRNDSAEELEFLVISHPKAHGDRIPYQA